MARHALVVLCSSVVLATSAPPSSIAGALDSEMLLQHYFQLAPNFLGGASRPFREAKQMAFSITESFGEVTNDDTEKVDGMVHKLASVLRGVAERVQTEADQLFKTAQKNKTKFLDEVNVTVTTASDTVVPEFAALVSKFVDSVVDPWIFLETVVKESASTVASALKAAGQEKPGTAVESGVDSALQNLASFLRKLDSAVFDCQNSVRDLAARDTEALLKRVDAKLNNALLHASQFILKFQEAFSELNDSLSYAVSWPSAEAVAVFSPVHESVTGAAWSMRSAAKDAVLPIHSGLVRLAKRAGVQAPTWHPLTMPVALGAASLQRL